VTDGAVPPPPPPSRAGRLLGEALKRGGLAFTANPLLLLAPLASAVATLAATALCLLALLVPFGLAWGSELRGLARLRGGWDSGTLGSLAERIVESPFLLLFGLLVAVVLSTLVLLLSAFLRAGTIAVLIAADRQAAEGSPRPAFRVRGAGTLFREAGGRHLMRFFWLLNLYGVVLTILVALFLVPLAALVFGAAKGQMLMPLVLTFLALPFLVAGAMLTRIVYVAAGRAIVVHDTGATDGVARGLTRIGETVGGTLGLYGLTLVAGLVLSGLFSVPRLIVFFAGSGSSGPSAWTAFAGSFVLTGLELAALSAFDIVTNGAFMALWAEAPVPEPALSGSPPAQPLPPLPAEATPEGTGAADASVTEGLS
jgi:hypothetical protein